MLNYRHIIWDWNGTLFDDAWLSVELINAILRKRQLPPVDAQRYQQDFDFPIREYYRRVGFDFAKEPYEALAAEFIAAYDRRNVECGLQPHADEVVHRFADGGYAQTILSATEQTRLETMVARFPALRSHFARLVGLDDFYAASKVDNGKRLIAELALAPQEVVLIGDTTHDFAVARAMGIDCILVPSGHHPREKLAQCDARLVNSLAELLCFATP